MVNLLAFFCFHATLLFAMMPFDLMQERKWHPKSGWGGKYGVSNVVAEHGSEFSG